MLSALLQLTALLTKLGTLPQTVLMRMTASCLLLSSHLCTWCWQVLNMKPIEILGMLEEAAGTRMYESKKDSALRTLEKKQIKVEEINKVGGCLAARSLPADHMNDRAACVQYSMLQASHVLAVHTPSEAHSIDQEKEPGGQADL